ncbi:MAG: hypothetical protein GDA51_12790 [Ekhidna sp.]|nr:hypothetical protein [Ekhidna sp.]
MEVLNNMKTLNINTYRKLIFQFVNKEISADQFEKDYISLFREFRDTGKVLEDVVSDIISELFTDVDAYCSDPELRDDDDIDEIELINRAKSSLKKLLDY